MNRLSGLVWMLVIVGAAFSLYLVKYRVQGVRTQVAEIERALETEKESLHVAAAEWAYLNRPQRLQVLAAHYLSATSVTADKIAEIDAIPMKEDVQPAAYTIEKNAGAAR